MQLLEAKEVYSIQLPKMPKEYITRLVFCLSVGTAGRGGTGSGAVQVWAGGALSQVHTVLSGVFRFSMRVNIVCALVVNYVRTLKYVFTG